MAKNVILVISSLIFTMLLIVVGEMIVRLTMDIPSLGNSANLFTPNAFGTSMGNTRNTEAISFGVKVYTDSNGFRTGSNQYSKEPPQHDKAILVLGDSVAFGSGVEFQKTFAGRLTNEDVQYRVYNSSVIGYRVSDYKNVASILLPEHMSEISAVFLIFCLNDISNLSATNINRALNKSSNSPVEADQNTDEPFTGIDSNTIIEKLKQWRLIAWANEYLRSRSKLYVLVKGAITDPQARYWEADLRSYQQLTTEGLATALQPLVYIADVCRRNNILFNVVIMPYEYQVRVDDESTRLPQQMLRKFFDTNDIAYVDALPLFRQRSAYSFLPYDPMHLSSHGHALLHEIITGVLALNEVGTGDEK